MTQKNTQFVFFGTPDIAVHILNELKKKNLLPSLIVTAPDRKQGRGMRLTPPDVKVWATERDIEVQQPEKLDRAWIVNLMQREYEFGVVAAYGKIIPQELIDIFPKGILNVHPSLLPLYRGASPIRSQILNDEQNIGVTIMLMDALLDHGPILTQEHVDIDNWPILGKELDIILARKSGELLAATIPSWLSGDINPQEQDHEVATHTKKIKKEDGELSFEDSAYTNFLKICAYDGWPRAYFLENGKRVIITKASYEDGELQIHSVIPEGKKEMAWEEYKRLT